jgi:prevent-host-death family protein
MCDTDAMATKEYGVRDLRNNTAKVLAAVEAGDHVFLTNRGKRVAELRPIVHETEIERLLDIADRVSPGDTGAFDDLMRSKRDDIAAQEKQDTAGWR